MIFIKSPLTSSGAKEEPAEAVSFSVSSLGSLNISFMNKGVLLPRISSKHRGLRSCHDEFSWFGMSDSSSSVKNSLLSLPFMEKVV